MNRWILAILITGLVLPAPVLAQESPEPEPDAPAEAESEDTQEDEEEEKSDFDELIEEATLREGFFDTYEKDGKLYLLIPEDRLGEEFLMTFEASQGPGTRGIYGGSMLDREARVVALEKHQGQVYLVQRPSIYTAPDGSPVQKSIDLTFGNSVLAVAKIEATREETDHLVDVYDWFVSDLSAVGERLRFTFSSSPGEPGSASFDKSRSYLSSVKAFPQNLTINTKLTFKPGKRPGLRSVPDNRYVPVTVHTRIAALPEVPMEPRLADDRVGYFMTVHKDFSKDDGQDFFVRYVRKWRLECAGPADSDGLCTPSKPITYYIDRTVPEQYRPAIMAGVEAFDEAFEAAGFRDAIRAEILPEGADAEDLQYATIRWNVSDPVGYGAIGPSVADPRTGEILDADILMEGNMILGYRNAWRFQVSPVAALTEMFEATPEDLEALANGAEMASFGEEMVSQGMLVRAMLAARGEIGPSEPVPMEYVNEAMKWVTMHEVGHTLGLRHNFRSSYDTPNDKLYDTGFTRENGVFSSVMEYPTPNIAPLGQENGDFYNHGMGTYDRWAIAYGYTADASHAADLARQAAKPGHAYGTDEDARGPGALDPTVNVYDLGQDPLHWGKGRAETIRNTWASVPSFALEDDASYANATYVFNGLLRQYARALATGVKYIGGQYQYRDHVGDPDGRGPWKNVERDRQVEALDFLVEYGFSETAFSLPEEVLQQFGADRWSHWGNTNTFNGRIDYPYHESVLSLQRALLRQITNPLVFSRIRDAEMKYGADQVLTIPELLNGLTHAVWSEVDRNENVPAMRRDLQRAHLDRMIELVTDAPGRTPADARSVARLELQGLSQRITASVEAGGADAYTHAHLNESNVRIDRALAAGLQLSN